MANDAPITIEQVVRHFKGLPHQLAALPLLEADIRDNGYGVAMRRNREWYAVWTQDGKQDDTAVEAMWLPLARSIVQQFEGCKLEAYPDPGTGGEPWTVGWGSTRIMGRAVRPKEVVTQRQADAQLEVDLRRFRDGVLAVIPAARGWSANRQAALVSFTYNVGLGALKDSTLAKRLNANEDPNRVAAEELPRWVSPQQPAVVEGLRRRRKAELDLFLGGAKPVAPKPATQAKPVAPAKPKEVKLVVPYFSQLDNKSGRGWRECFSSSCAMAAAYWGKVKSDDEYNAIRAKYGDTTDSQAQVQALRSLGLDARLITNAAPGMIETLLQEGCPVPVGWLHQGHVDAPKGGGHWSVVVAYNDKSWIHNDPNGQADLVNGGYVNHTKGKAVVYSRANWDRRWQVPTPGTGWLMHIRPLSPRSSS